MDTHTTNLADADDLGTLGVVFLKRYWSQNLARRTGQAGAPPTPAELCAENVLLAGLELGIRETTAYLMTEAPSFAAFEAWVLAKNGGSLAPERVARLNSALRQESTFVLESLLPEPVLTPDDLAFWDENGYVVVREAISAAQCAATVEAIYAHAQLDPEDPETWYGDALWLPLAHHPALWENRRAPRIHTAFAQLWQRQDLWINVDVCGVNPPERPGYSFRGSPLHWDMSLARPVYFGTQAILYLTDTTADQGAFSCVPGFHTHLESWLEALPPGTDPREWARETLQPTPIAGAAGDLIIWHHALPHGATPNRAARPRVVQYLNLFPSHHALHTEWV